MSLINSFLVRWRGGWVEQGDSASKTANGRAEAHLSLGEIPSTVSAQKITNVLLGVTASSKVASVAEVEPITGQVPYIDFDTFDSVRVTGPDGEFDTVKVRAITCEVDDDRQPFWTLEVANLVAVREQETETMLRRLASGFLSGSTETVNPARPARAIEAGEVRAKEWRASKSGVLSIGELESQKERFGTVAHLCLFLVTITTAASSGTTTVVLKVSGTTVATVSIAAGSNTGWVGIAHQLVNSIDTLQAVLTATGTGAEGLVATARYI